MTHTNLTPDDAQEKFLPPPKPQLPINFFIVITNKHTIKKILLHAGVDDSFALQKKNINLLIEETQKKTKTKRRITPSSSAMHRIPESQPSKFLGSYLEGRNQSQHQLKPYLLAPVKFYPIK
jgi:hypothetical protein